MLSLRDYRYCDVEEKHVATNYPPALIQSKLNYCRLTGPDFPLYLGQPCHLVAKSGRERIIELAQRENLTVRQLAQRVGGFGGLAFVGTPAKIADQMEEWLLTVIDGPRIDDPLMCGLNHPHIPSAAQVSDELEWET
jgi:alkanesulfonate monooxygenase SsuD/methylene tetrahydromethanopterin reductase-like flavin-dependent oxidoreductase (luciferase family)